MRQTHSNVHGGIRRFNRFQRGNPTRPGGRTGGLNAYFAVALAALENVTYV